MPAFRYRTGMLVLLLFAAVSASYFIWRWVESSGSPAQDSAVSLPQDDSAAELPLSPRPLPVPQPALWKDRRSFLFQVSPSLIPSEALALSEKARAIGDYESSRNLLQQALAAAPSDPLLLIALADTNHGLLRNDDARVFYLKAQQTATPHAESYTGLTQLAIAARNREDALRWMRKGLSDIRRSAPTEDNFVLLGRAYADLNDFGDAETALKFAMEAAPGDAQAQIQMASLLLRTGRTPEAQALLEKALQQHPDSGGICRLLATALTGAADPHPDFPRARALLEKAAELTPLDIEIYRAAAMVYQHEKLYRLAAQAYDAVLRLDPASVDARYGLGQVYGILGKTDLARKQLELSEVLRGRQQKLNSLKESVKESPRDPGKHLSLAHLDEEFGLYPAAVQQYQIAVELDPGNPTYRASLAHLYGKLGWG